MEPTTLLVLQLLLLATDGVGAFASFTIAQYYKPKKTGEDAIWQLHVYFWMMTIVFAGLVVSDALVIAKWPPSWATLPIVRGLIFRLPISLVGLWMIHKQHVR